MLEGWQEITCLKTLSWPKQIEQQFPVSLKYQQCSVCAVYINQQTSVCGCVAQDGGAHPASGSCLLSLNSTWIWDRQGENWGWTCPSPRSAQGYIQVLPKAMCSHAKFIYNLGMWVECFMWANGLCELLWRPNFVECQYCQQVVPHYSVGISKFILCSLIVLII